MTIISALTVVAVLFQPALPAPPLVPRAEAAPGLDAAGAGLVQHVVGARATAPAGGPHIHAG